MNLTVWLLDPARWTGSDSIPVRILEHIQMSATAVCLACLLALPVGVYVGHTGRGAFVALSAGNVGRALPSLAVLALALPVAFRFGLGLGYWPTVLMLIPLGVPLILLNTYTALRNVDPDALEVARGLGMRGAEILRSVSLPLAAPLILAGIRTAAVTIVATAPLGALVASGGLGRYIVDGLARREDERLLAGALLVALLSVVTEVVFATFERLLLPRGVRRAYSAT